MKEGSFAIDQLNVSEVSWNSLECESQMSESHVDGAYNVTQLMRAVAEPLLVSHFGENIIEELFNRYKKILTDRMSKEKTKFVNVTILLTRKP